MGTPSPVTRLQDDGPQQDLNKIQQAQEEFLHANGLTVKNTFVDEPSPQAGAGPRHRHCSWPPPKDAAEDTSASDAQPESPPQLHPWASSRRCTSESSSPSPMGPVPALPFTRRWANFRDKGGGSEPLEPLGLRRLADTVPGVVDDESPSPVRLAADGISELDVPDVRRKRTRRGGKGKKNRKPPLAAASLEPPLTPDSSIRAIGGSSLQLPLPRAASSLADKPSADAGSDVSRAGAQPVFAELRSALEGCFSKQGE